MTEQTDTEVLKACVKDLAKQVEELAGAVAALASTQPHQTAATRPGASATTLANRVKTAVRRIQTRL